MSILSRYLDAEALNRLAGRSFEPEGLVLGNLAGGHRSPLAGFAVEFAGHREYVPGDDPRHIDWRLLFTRDKLFIKQYEMETNFVCYLVLDISASMRYGADEANKLVYASRLAATLAIRSFARATRSPSPRSTTRFADSFRRAVRSRKFIG